VNGYIFANEIQVKSDVWADHVFTNDYQLPTLNEVKLHIDENKHLPGIPTEAEIKENGVNLGEMQVKLLQKIEELTLYLIQQDETIQELKAEIQELKEK
jgi:spore germination protein GerM